jgi:hypothetical protein
MQTLQAAAGAVQDITDLACTVLAALAIGTWATRKHLTGEGPVSPRADAAASVHAEQKSHRNVGLAPAAASYRQ